MISTERFRLLAVLPIMGIGGMLVWALWSLPPEAAGLSIQVRDHLADSGVRAEVTAVLLNFRGYDTLLEVAVLLAALLGVWTQGRMRISRDGLETVPVLGNLTGLLLPVTVLMSGYVLWLGGHAAGGAFQAGALLAGAGVLLLAVSPERFALRNNKRLRALLIAGPAVFALVAGAVVLAGGTLLQYPLEYAGILILLIEAACTVSIGITLTLLFAGGRPSGGGHE